MSIFDLFLAIKKRRKIREETRTDVYINNIYTMWSPESAPRSTEVRLCLICHHSQFLFLFQEN